MDFVKRGCVYVLVLLCVGVLVICVLEFTVFCIVCTVFLYCFVYVRILFVLSVLVQGLLPPSENSTAKSNNNNNNNNNNNIQPNVIWHICGLGSNQGSPVIMCSADSKRSATRSQESVDTFL